MRTAIFIDGGYLNKVIATEHNSVKINYRKLVEGLCPPEQLLRSYYYNCLPHQGSSPTEAESKRFAGAESFHSALRRIPKFEVREGRLEHRGQDIHGEPIYVQKRIDVAMACDITMLSTKRAIEKAILITGDSDFLPLIGMAKDEGINVTLVHGISACRPHADLWEAADERIGLESRFIQSIRY